MNGVLPYWLAKRICNEWPRVHGAAFVPADLGPCDALILDPPPARGSMRVFDASPPPTPGIRKITRPRSGGSPWPCQFGACFGLRSVRCSRSASHILRAASWILSPWPFAVLPLNDPPPVCLSHDARLLLLSLDCDNTMPFLRP